MTSAPPGPVSNDGQPSRIPAAVPLVLAQRYELGPLLGQGGSAQVHRAWDRLLNRAVAVKLFAPGLAGPDRYRQDHELAALTRLVHPGLVTLYDAGVDHGRGYLVMRLVQGPTLADRLRGVSLPVATVAELGAQLASTLAYVHARGVIHRDIKPANVLLDEQNHPLLADFGIALLVDVTRVTLTGATVGTAAYMAPEQVRGELVDPAADVFSLGLVLLEALTGRREYPGTSVESACARLHRAPAVPDNLPAGLTYTLRRMTAIEPAERPTSAAAASELQAAAIELHGGPATVHTELVTELPGEPMQPARPSKQWRRVVLAGAASGVVLTAGLLGLTALDSTTDGVIGIASPPPTTVAPLPAPPTGPPLSVAPLMAPMMSVQATGTPLAVAVPVAAPPAAEGPVPAAHSAALTQSVTSTETHSGSDHSHTSDSGSPGTSNPGSSSDSSSPGGSGSPDTSSPGGSGSPDSSSPGGSRSPDGSGSDVSGGFSDGGHG
ncbi:MAG: serine/threonine protein kinase [Actinomycetota bacterium]|nr:serine/threonine protein kinase [Actinomycetota bacterium]